MIQTIDRSISPAVSALKGMPFPRVRRSVLHNGVKLVILNHGQQPVNRVTVVWNVGMADVGSPEALKLLCHTINEGTNDHDGSWIAETLEYYGAWMRMDCGSHSTVLTVHSLNHSASEVLPIFGEMICGATYPDETFCNIREKIAASLKLEMQKVAAKAVVLGKKMLYGCGNPMARTPLPEVMAEIRRSDVIDLHNNLILGLRPTVYIAGAVTPALETLAAGVFGNVSFCQTGVAPESKIVPQRIVSCSETEWVADESSMQTAVRVIIPTVDRLHPDYEQLRFTVFALGGYFGSRLMSNIREDKGYTYGINASLSAGPEGGNVTIACQTDKSHTLAVLEEIENEIMRMGRQPMDGNELDVVKHTIMTGLATLLDSPFSIMDYHQQIDAMGLPVDYYERQLAELERFNQDIVVEMTGRYLLDVPRLTALAGVPVEMG